MISPKTVYIVRCVVCSNIISISFVWFLTWKDRTKLHHVTLKWCLFPNCNRRLVSHIVFVSLSIALFRFVGWNGRYAYICKQTLSSSFNLICRTIECAFKFEQRERESEKIAHKWYQNSLNWLTEKCFSTKIIQKPIC